MDKIEIFKSICDEMSQTYERKNHDYGESFAKLREAFPNAVLVRLFDKYMRLRTLMSGEQAQVNESIEDTLIDLANYAIMELVERRSKTAIKCCSTCKYEHCPATEWPCGECTSVRTKWEPKEM